MKNPPTLLGISRTVSRNIKVGSIVADSYGERYEVREVFDKTLKAVKETFSNPIHTLEISEVNVIRE